MACACPAKAGKQQAIRCDLNTIEHAWRMTYGRVDIHSFISYEHFWTMQQHSGRLGAFPHIWTRCGPSDSIAVAPCCFTQKLAQSLWHIFFSYTVYQRSSSWPEATKQNPCWSEWSLWTVWSPNLPPAPLTQHLVEVEGCCVLVDSIWFYNITWHTLINIDSYSSLYVLTCLP